MVAVDTTSTDNIPTEGSGKSFRKNSSTQLIAGIMALATAQVIGIAVARTLGPEGKGLVSLLTLITTISVILTDFGLTISGVYLVGSRKYRPQDVVSTYVGLAVVVGTAVTALLILLQKPLASILFDGRHSELIVVVAIGIPAGLLYGWLVSILRGQDNIVAVSMINIAGTIIGLGVILALLYVFRAGAASVVWGSNATLVFSLMSTVYILRKQLISFRPRLNTQLLRTAVNYGMRSQVGQILQFMNYRFDLLVVNALLGTSSVGIYGVGASVSQVIWQIPNALAYALYSRVSALEAQEGNKMTLKVARQSLILSLLAALILVPLGYYAIPVLFGRTFTAAVNAMWFLLPGVVLLSHYKILGAHMGAQGHPEYGSYAAGISAVATIVLDFILIPRMGINGAAVASSIAYGINSSLCVYWFLRTTGLKDISLLFVPQRGDIRINRRRVSGRT